MEQELTAESLWLLLAISLTAGGVIYQCVAAGYRNWRMKRRFRRGEIAERNAVKFLRHRGYKILAAQLQETIVVYVDGKPEKSTVRADFLVRKGWKKYIVEVKSGQQGTVRLPNVRRQLLEYKLVYQPDGILLLDMENRALQEIRFAYPRRNSKRLLWYGVFCLLTGLVVYQLWQLW